MKHRQMKCNIPEPINPVRNAAKGPDITITTDTADQILVCLGQCATVLRGGARETQMDMADAIDDKLLPVLRLVFQKGEVGHG